MRALKILISLIVLLGAAVIARAEGPEARTALVIGNAAYDWAPLRNPVNDAEAMAEALENAGFKVIIESDADKAKMVAAVRDFGKALKQKGGVGLFYFSGHGMQIDGENYLLPVGGEYEDFEDVKKGSVTALTVVNAMAQANSDLSIFILDACRNNPIDPNGAKGLSRITFGKDGALDGEWADGSATETLELVANAASDEVDLAEGTYTVEGTNADGKDYEGTVEIEKDGDDYHLSWEVGDSSYEGTGSLAGNLLTVDWGGATPIVYALADDGSLSGLWDAGQGEETLTPE